MSASPGPAGNSGNNSDEMILRCPFCKTHVLSSDAECPICGEALTAQNVLRVKSSVKIFSKPLLVPAESEPPRNQTTESDPTPEASALPDSDPAPVAPVPTELPIAKPRTEPLKPPRRLTQPNPRVSEQSLSQQLSRQPSGYTVGVLVGFAVIVVGAAILIGVNLAQQTTTEAKATAEEIPQQTAKITVVYKEATATESSPPPTLIQPAPTATGVLPQPAQVSIATAIATATRAMEPSLTPTPEIIPNFSPTPTAQPTLAPSATPSPTPLPPATATPIATRTALPTTPPIATATPVVEQWNVSLAAARYETSGRPRQACSNFDANDPVRKFTFTLRIQQNTGKDLAANDWGVAAFVGDARVQQVCYFKTEGPTPPALPNGAQRQVTLSAFVGQGQNVTMLVVGDTTGSAGRICVRETEVVVCE
jgi:hypothetical protein